MLFPFGSVDGFRSISLVMKRKLQRVVIIGWWKVFGGSGWIFEGDGSVRLESWYIAPCG